MKYPILITLLVAFATAIYAQKPRTETFGDRRTDTYLYKKGGDSIAFSILGKADTLKITDFNRNGKPRAIYWKKDSVYFFDAMGRLYRRLYYKKNVDERLNSYFNRAILDSSISYYINGRIYETYNHKDGVFWDKTYAKDGRLVLTTYEKQDPSVSSRREVRDRNGVLMESSRADSLIVDNEVITHHFDTIFHDNGRPLMTRHYLQKLTNTATTEETFSRKYFNKDGTLFIGMRADSLQLIPFKDNVDCYYGLKNKRDDTIVRPRFDHIEEIAFNYRAAYVGSSAIILSPEGAPMLPPSDRLSNVFRLNKYPLELSRSEQEKMSEDVKKRNMNQYGLQSNDYFSFTDGEKHGVMTHDGKLLMPPQYFNLSGLYLDNGNTYFGFLEQKGDTIIQSGFLNRQGKPIFSKRFNWVYYLKNDYFLISNDTLLGLNGGYNYNSMLMGHFSGWTFFGLGKGSDETVILPPKFNEIKHLSRSNTYLVRIDTYDEKMETQVRRHGIFNPRSQKWLLDTTDFVIENVGYEYDPLYFVFKNIKTKKSGIMDTTGKLLAAVSFDSIGRIDGIDDVFWVKKGNKYHILDIKNGKANLHKTSYDFLGLANFHLSNDRESEHFTHFVAKRNNKWGLIDAEDRIIKPFEYDYAALKTLDGLVMVKDNQAFCFDLASLPNTTPHFPHLNQYDIIKKSIGSYKLSDNSDRVFFINDTGRVVIPPQYVLLNDVSNQEYVLVEDAKKEKKIILLGTGKVINYPFNYGIETVHPKSRVLLVRDTTENSVGVVSIEGQLLIPCKNYAVAISDVETSTFFVKRDTPLFQRFTPYTERGETLYRWHQVDVNGDTLNVEDNNWLMYDGAGILLSKAAFRFPIVFKNGLGIGMKGDDFNLYKTDGSVFNVPTEGSVSPTYRNIRRDPKTDFYALFRNQGMTPTVVLTKNDGQIIIKSGRYDGISRFYGKYALVSAKGLIGLVDSFGQEIIAPQDLRTYKGQFIDSLNASNKIVLQKVDYNYEDITYLPITLVTHDPLLNPDSLKISPQQRNILWNLMLDKALLTTVGTASDLQIPRVELVSSSRFVTTIQQEAASYTPIRIIVEDNTMAFAWQKSIVYGVEGQAFHNFYRRNNRWEALTINDLLNIQGNKRWALNDLLIQKVKALKDAEIDCSNTSGFILKVENRFMLTKTGLDFCFESEQNPDNLVIVSFTWAELSPFLKMRIAEK